MEEFNKALNFLHRTLMVAAAAALAFALSADPTEDLLAAKAAVEFAAKADVQNYAAAVAADDEKAGLFAEPQVAATDSDPALDAAYAKCLDGSKIHVSYMLVIVVVPDLDTVSIGSLSDYLSHGSAYLLQVSRRQIARTLKAANIDCDGAIAGGLQAIRIGTSDMAIRNSGSVDQGVLRLSSLYLAKYDELKKPGQVPEEFNFALMDALGQTATLELEYQTGDALTVKSLLAPGLASPAIDVVTNPFAKYFPHSPGDQTSVLAALRNESELIAAKTVQGAGEVLRAKIEETRKYPTVYGVEVRSAHAAWGIPALTLALMVFFLIHTQAYRRFLRGRHEVSGPFVSAIGFWGWGASVVRLVTVVVLPAVANALLVLRLAGPETGDADLGLAISFLIAATGVVLLFRFKDIRHRLRQLEETHGHKVHPAAHRHAKG